MNNDHPKEMTHPLQCLAGDEVGNYLQGLLEEMSPQDPYSEQAEFAEQQWAFDGGNSITVGGGTNETFTFTPDEFEREESVESLDVPCSVGDGNGQTHFYFDDTPSIAGTPQYVGGLQHPVEVLYGDAPVPPQQPIGLTPARSRGVAATSSKRPATPAVTTSANSPTERIYREYKKKTDEEKKTDRYGKKRSNNNVSVRKSRTKKEVEELIMHKRFFYLEKVIKYIRSLPHSHRSLPPPQFFGLPADFGIIPYSPTKKMAEKMCVKYGDL
ncbi:hypothetical protein PFISCL1PPCAC_9769 [Pristionchus fissidentatus]|uniref:BZIP domain-containing protein n=1 Tax=Pristionchus fissidentatus TaxID=1538716 RepID=A0AAV5VFH5_9BILA|nr:hypothetical protein PFISCL1PPCAC_9769 [Pristionchus fissidentatus]